MTGAMLERDLEGLLAALQFFHVELRSNVRTGNPEVRRLDHGSPAAGQFTYSLGLDPAPDGWAILSDRPAAKLRNMMERVFKDRDGKRYRLSDDLFNRALRAALAGRDVDPVKTWLEALPRWDGHERIPTLFVEALGAEDTVINRAAARVLMVGAIARTYNPGCKHEDVPTLIGGQGAGKSTFVLELLPPGYPHWFGELKDLSDKRQHILEGIGEALIVEVAEMRGTFAVNEIKNFVSSRSDRYRKPYQQTADNLSRRWVAIGTANDNGDGALPDDPTGNRRWIAVPVQTPGESREAQSTHVRCYLAANRTQLWAEAYAKYHEGVKHWIGAKEEVMQDEVNLRYTRANQPLRDIADRLTETHVGGAPIPLMDLLLESGVAKDEQEAVGKMQKEGAMLAGYLKQRSWERSQTTIEGKRRVYWVPPVLAETAAQAAPICAKCERPIQVGFGYSHEGKLYHNTCLPLGDGAAGGAKPMTPSTHHPELESMLGHEITVLSERARREEGVIVQLRGLYRLRKAAPDSVILPRHIVTLGGGNAALAIIRFASDLAAMAVDEDAADSIDWERELLGIRRKAEQMEQQTNEERPQQLSEALKERLNAALRLELWPGASQAPQPDLAEGV